MPWEEVARAAGPWANAHELALAKRMVADDAAEGDSGKLLVEIAGRDEAGRELAGVLSKAIAGRSMLGLSVEPSVPSVPSGPSVGVRVQVSGPAGRPEASVQVAVSDASGTAWVAAGKFPLVLAMDEEGAVKAEAFGEALADGLIKRLVGVKVSKASSGGPIPKAPRASDAYVIRVENYSPLLLNAVAVVGAGAKAGESPRTLAGIALPPRRVLSFPASAESVEKSGLRQGARVTALDLSSL